MLIFYYGPFTFYVSLTLVLRNPDWSHSTRNITTPVSFLSLSLSLSLLSLSLSLLSLSYTHLISGPFTFSRSFSVLYHTHSRTPSLSLSRFFSSWLSSKLFGRFLRVHKNCSAPFLSNFHATLVGRKGNRHLKMTESSSAAKSSKTSNRKEH